MRPFAYQRASDAEAAVHAVAAAGGRARYLAGGTNLVDLMKLGVETPELLVDVSRLGHDRVEERPDGGLRIGAGVSNTDLAGERAVRERYPVLAMALLGGACGQLRNMATVGGNLLQRTRCPYFQDVSKPCNKRDPGSGCPAREGRHRDLAILGHSPSCVATHPSDMAVALSALDAEVAVLGPAGRRTIPHRELHRLPDGRPEHDTALEPGELIVAVELPPLGPAARSTYRKVRDRASFTFAVVSVAAVVELGDGILTDCRICLGGVAHAPWRALRAEEALRGRPAAAASFAAAAAAELDRAEPLRENGFKVKLAETMIVRTLVELTGAG